VASVRTNAAISPLLLYSSPIQALDGTGDNSQLSGKPLPVLLPRQSNADNNSPSRFSEALPIRTIFSPYDPGHIESLLSVRAARSLWAHQRPGGWVHHRATHERAM
jgi:hypothetical protein